MTWEAVAQPILIFLWLVAVWAFKTALVTPYETGKWRRALEWATVLLWATVCTLAGLVFGVVLRFR